MADFRHRKPNGASGADFVSDVVIKGICRHGDGVGGVVVCFKANRQPGDLFYKGF